MLQQDATRIANSFRLRKNTSKANRYSSINSKNNYSKTVGKKEFEQFL